MRLLCFLVLGGLLGGCDAAVQTKSGSGDTQGLDLPNIVVLFADDLGYGDLGSYGHPNIRTPNLDALAARGQRWTDFYMAASVCSPSRAALLTGRLPVRTGLYGDVIRVFFPDEAEGFPADELTLAEALKRHGYRTGIFGKWHLGDSADALPTRHGFDSWLGVPYSNDMNWVGQPEFEELVRLSLVNDIETRTRLFADRAAKYAAPEAAYWEVPLVHSHRRSDGVFEDSLEQPTDQGELTQRYTEAAIAFMEASEDAPFFVYLPYTMPHTPLFRSDAFAGQSIGGRYGDTVEEIDWSVGEIQRALRRLGLTEETLVVFTSDNGPWLTMREEGGSAGLLRNGKGTTFEGGMRVPAIFSWPGKIAPGVTSEIGASLDLFTTVMALLDEEAETALDGLDLGPTLFSGAASPRSEMPYYRGGTLYAYRQGLWKLHLVTEGAYGQAPPKTVHETPQLFHLGRDPAERFDVADQHPEVVDALRQDVDAHRASITKKPSRFDQRVALVQQRMQQEASPASRNEP